MTTAGVSPFGLSLALPLSSSSSPLALSSSSSSSSSFSDRIIRDCSLRRLESSWAWPRFRWTWTRTRSATTPTVGGALSGPSAIVGSSGMASTVPSAINQRITGSSPTTPVLMASRSAAFGIKITRLRSDPGIGSTLAGLPGLAVSAAREVPPARTNAARPARIGAEDFHRSSRMLLTPMSGRRLRLWLWLRLRARQAQVKGGNHEQAHDGGGHQTAQDGHRHRMQDLQTGDVAEGHQGQDGGSDRRGACQDRPEPLARATQDKPQAEGLALLPLETLITMDQPDALAYGDAGHGEAGGNGTEREGAPGRNRRQHAARGHRKDACEQQGRQSPALEAGLQEQVDADRSGQRRDERPPAGGPARLVVAQQHGMIIEGERDLLQLLLDVRPHGTHASSGNAGADVDAPRDPLALDDGRRRHHAHVGHVREPHVTIVGRVDQKLANIREVLARFWRAPHHHLEDLLLLVQIADLEPGKNGCHRPPDVARLEADASGCREIHLDLHRS